ncbi:MAG TPA: hypothetical protein PKE17_18840 [Saprospiraceae bacterium]|nr:hypothetical protein [Saprospiraceae bacterium]
MSVKSMLSKVVIIAGVLLLLFLVAVGLLVYPIFAVNRPPKITNAAQLVADCQALVELRRGGSLQIEQSDAWTRGTISSNQWPDSIYELNPRGVFVLDDRVSIFISTGGIGPSFGYLIPYLKSTNFNHIGGRRTIISGSYVTRTRHENIFYWASIE